MDRFNKFAEKDNLDKAKDKINKQDKRVLRLTRGMEELKKVSEDLLVRIKAA